nr:MAG TPA: hypothetical protein [Caudoviricetes sp.]
MMSLSNFLGDMLVSPPVWRHHPLSVIELRLLIHTGACCLYFTIFVFYFKSKPVE